MEKETQNNASNDKKRMGNGPIILIFSIALVVVCFFAFIFNYDIAYIDRSDGGWLPPSFGVVMCYFWVVVFSIIVAFIIKMAVKERVKFWALLVASVLIPIICYNLNHSTLQKGGIFYGLVDKGGMFHFIAIGDYNFDGMNDEQHHILYEERTIRSGCGGHYDDTVIRMIQTESTGTGPALNAFCSYEWEDKVIELHINKENIKYKEIKVRIEFEEKIATEKVRFYIGKEQLTPTNVKPHSVTLVFDEAVCAEWQNNSEKEYIEILINYYVD